MRQIFTYLALAGVASALSLKQQNADNDFSPDFNDFSNDDDFENVANEFEEEFGDFDFEQHLEPEQAASAGA